MNKPRLPDPSVTAFAIMQRIAGDTELAGDEKKTTAEETRTTKRRRARATSPRPAKRKTKP
jgi:hypothetical protein